MLFPTIIYGPIHSRRLGISLGVNLMPVARKICTFDCVYCECGFNLHDRRHGALPTAEQVASELEQQLCDLRKKKVTLDVITFSGNGEPTLHHEFERIMADTVRLRDKYCPSAKISVLSNSTQLYREDVRRGLMMADNRILKLDSAINTTMKLIDRPVDHHLTVEKIVEYLKLFNGDFTLQTCFLSGQVPAEDGMMVDIDNTTDTEVEAWLKILPAVNPKEIMIYVIDRETPVRSLNKISPDIMHRIASQAEQTGFHVIVSA